ncbi:hypothetical protein [Streptomyces sp. V3I8]|nr:hypothetical protein [Streptomyces sp. V3I8]
MARLSAAGSVARPEIDRFNGEVRDLLGDQGFARTSAVPRTLAHWGLR